MIFALLFFIHSISASLIGGGAMPDGKVDKVVSHTGEATNHWHGPVWGADIAISMAPNWRALQEWNNATLGLGVSYWNMGHEKLGHAISPYAYMDIPLVRLRHFELGLRPGIGIAFMTKTYSNTIDKEHLYKDAIGANDCIGSVTNLYFPEALYMNFPLAKGWKLTLAGGWYHISNGSIRQPNSGYNIFGGTLGVQKMVGREGYQAKRREGDEAMRREGDEAKKWSISIAGTAGGRQVYYKDQQTFAVASMHMAAYWHACKRFRLGGGVDAFYDGAYIPRETRFGKTNLAAAQKGDCWRVGVSVQPELVVGNFTAGFHVGAYMYDPVKNLEPKSEAEKTETGRLDKEIFYAYDFLKAGSAGNPDGWLYTEVVLRYHLPWNIFLQGMMKSHLTKVEFVSLGIGLYY